MLVECPNCHRRYEPKPNEKYCPCCGEEIKEPLKNIEPEPKVITKEVPAEKAPVSAVRRNVGRALSFAACIIGFLTFVFLFGPVFYTGSQSLIQLTFISKDASNKAYVGLIIAFIVYVVMFLTNIYATYKAAKDEANGSRIGVAVMQIFLVLFYAFYLTFKFKTNYGGYSGTTTNTYPLGDGATRLLITLGTSALLNIIAPFVD